MLLLKKNIKNAHIMLTLKVCTRNIDFISRNIEFIKAY